MTTGHLAADVTDVHGSITRSSVEADLAHGGHKVVLVNDEQTTKRATAWLPSYEARELARNLLAQADEADRLDGTGTKGSFQVTDNITGQPVRGALSQDAAGQLCRGLNLQAGPGARYRVDPDAAQLAGETDAAEFHARHKAVLYFLTDALNGDAMSLDEIAANLTAIARGEG